MKRSNYHIQAIDMLGWIFNWYRDKKNHHYRVPDGFHIHHIDGDYTNNSLDNLIIITEEEHKAIHKDDKEFKKALAKGGSMTGRTNGKKTCKPIMCVETHEIFESGYVAQEQTGISNKNISLACNGKRKTAGGFHWVFI